MSKTQAETLNPPEVGIRAKSVIKLLIGTRKSGGTISGPHLDFTFTIGTSLEKVMDLLASQYTHFLGYPAMQTWLDKMQAGINTHRRWKATDDRLNKIERDSDYPREIRAKLYVLYTSGVHHLSWCEVDTVHGLITPLNDNLLVSESLEIMPSLVLAVPMMGGQVVEYRALHIGGDYELLESDLGALQDYLLGLPAKDKFWMSSQPDVKAGLSPEYLADIQGFSVDQVQVGTLAVKLPEYLIVRITLAYENGEEDSEVHKISTKRGVVRHFDNPSDNYIVVTPEQMAKLGQVFIDIELGGGNHRYKAQIEECNHLVLNNEDFLHMCDAARNAIFNHGSAQTHKTRSDVLRIPSESNRAMQVKYREQFASGSEAFADAYLNLISGRLDHISPMGSEMATPISKMIRIELDNEVLDYPLQVIGNGLYINAEQLAEVNSKVKS